MAFTLPEDTPEQKLQDTARSIGMIVGQYAKKLKSDGLPDKLVLPLTLQYAQFMTNLVYGQLPPVEQPSGPATKIRREIPPPEAEG